MIGKSSISYFAAAALGCACAAAEPRVVNDPYMKTAIARTRVEMSFRDAEPVFDPVANGCVAAWTAAEKAKTRIDQLLTTAVEAEQERGETRDEEFIAGCEQRLNRLAESWTALDEQTRPILDSRLDRVTARFEAAHDVLASLIEQEPGWKKAGLDLTALDTVYEVIEKRLAELVSEADQVIGGVKARQAEFETELKDAEKFLAEREIAAKQTAAEADDAPAPVAPEQQEEAK